MSGRVLLAILLLPVVIGAFAYLAARRAIGATERMAEKAAATQVGRPIEVRCPGPIAERFDRPLLYGRVDFDADGVPKPYTKLSPKACKGLRLVNRHMHELHFGCLRGGGCANGEASAALGVAVLTHELMHLRGVTDEAVTECFARRRLPAVAKALGLTAEQAEAIAAYQTGVLEPQLGPQYQGGSC